MSIIVCPKNKVGDTDQLYERVSNYYEYIYSWKFRVTIILIKGLYDIISQQVYKKLIYKNNSFQKHSNFKKANHFANFNTIIVNIYFLGYNISI